MGVFKRRSGMIDVVDMQKRGLIKLPTRSPSGLKAGKDGFVEISRTSSSLPSSTAQTATEPIKEEKSGGGWFGSFFGGGDSSSSSASSNSSVSSSSMNQFSTEDGGYSKREVDAKIEEMDNKIYRMEQRLEVLERKNGVGSW